MEKEENEVACWGECCGWCG